MADGRDRRAALAAENLRDPAVGSAAVDSATHAIEVAELEKRYGDTRAVDGVTLAIAAGEVFGLLGPNGAGKTTTVEILEGYRRADAGEVRVLGLDPWVDGTRLRPQIGVMLQNGGLYPGLKPLEALQLFASYYENPDDPERLLHLVGLEDSRGTMVRRMSGGQQQRLSLALALVGRPSLVFLDEPTAGMDPHARATTWSMIRELRDNGATVLLTTHAMDEAEHLCDRVAIVDHGRVVACGSPVELTTKATVAETTFAAAPGLDVAALATTLGLPDSAVRERGAGDYVVDAPATPELVAGLTGWLRDENVLISELRAGRRSLEDVFLRLTGEGRP
jgi:ABC-2 type transport system ATP-binding protein